MGLLSSKENARKADARASVDSEFGPTISVDENAFRTADGDFDEWTYLHHNADVARDVREGRFESGLHHFRSVGLDQYRNGKRQAPPTVREQSYLLRNADVATAIANGHVRSGHAHWLEYGREEEARGLRRPWRSAAPADVTGVDLSTWRDGYVVLPGLFSHAQCDAIVEYTERLWRDRRRINQPIDVDIFLNQPTERKVRMSEAPDEAYQFPLKINNLYFWNPLVRAAMLDARLCGVIRHLIDGDPVALTSLNFRKGSEQGLHLDTFYMPPAIPYRMVAAWVALEDVGMENGPLRYVPGSNRIPPFYFDGHRLRTNNTPQEYDAFGKYFGPKIERRELSTQHFMPRKGDVLIWHSLLFHGGSPIGNPDATRNSMVAHYFAAADYPAGSVTGATGIIQHDYGCFYEDRPPAVGATLWPGQASY